MRDRSVVRLSPSRWAAPFGPATTPLLSFSTDDQLIFILTFLRQDRRRPRGFHDIPQSGRESCSTLPRVSNTARSITFSSSRTLPGHSIRVRVRRVSAGMLSILRPMRRAMGGKRLHQQRDIVGTFAQRRQVDREHVEPVVEIAAEFRSITIA